MDIFLFFSKKEAMGALWFYKQIKYFFFCRYNIGLMLTNKLTFGKTHAAFIFLLSHEKIVFLRKNQKRNMVTFRAKIRLFTIQIVSSARLPLPSFSRKYPPHKIQFYYVLMISKIQYNIGLQFRKWPENMNMKE